MRKNHGQNSALLTRNAFRSHDLNLRIACGLDLFTLNPEGALAEIQSPDIFAKNGFPVSSRSSEKN